MGSERTQLCRFDGCTNPVRTDGLCARHRQQVSKGEGLRPLRLRIPGDVPTKDRILARAVITDEGCWELRGSSASPYGTVWDGKRTVLAHRAAWEAWIGPLAPGTVVHHACGNQRCCNAPGGHLQAVTPEENTAEWLDRREHMNRIAALEAELADLRRTCTCPVNQTA